MKRKELIEKLKPYWKEVIEAEQQYSEAIQKIEKKMGKGIDVEDLEIFYVEGEIVGIGNYSRSIKLIHRHEIEE